MKTINTKELLKGILIIFSYFIIGNILTIPFSYINNIAISNILLYLSLAIIYSIIYLKDLIKDFKRFKENYKYILKTTIKYWLIGVVIMIISSNIIKFFNVPVNVNQEANNSILVSMPLVEIICACIFAPIIEELIFRRSLKEFTQNKHLYALTSGLIFAFVHLLSSLSTSNSLIMLVYLIPYGALGIAFGYAYEKTDNIYGTILIHSLHNAISLLELIILGGLL